MKEEEKDKEKDDILLEDPENGSEKAKSKLKCFVIIGICVVAVIIFIVILMTTMKTNEKKERG
jgi:flagellar basal body-associated protein FliL